MGISYDFENFANLRHVFIVHSATHDWTIEFFAMITDYNETYKSNYSTEQVYGKMDPLRIYQNTERSLSVSLVAMARDLGEGLHLQQKLSFLAANMYPSYAVQGSATTLASPPYFKLLFGNIINSNAQPFFNQVSGEERTPVGFGPAGRVLNQRDVGGRVRSYNVLSDGLTGIIEKFSITPSVKDLGFFTLSAPFKVGEFVEEGGEPEEVLGDAPIFVPKGYQLELTFSIIHNVNLGWDMGTNTPFNPNFPYGYDNERYEQVSGRAFHPAQPTDFGIDDDGNQLIDPEASSDLVGDPRRVDVLG